MQIEIKLGMMFWAFMSIMMYLTGWAELFWFTGIAMTILALIWTLGIASFFSHKDIRNISKTFKPMDYQYVFSLVLYASLIWQFYENGYIIFSGSTLIVLIIGFVFRIYAGNNAKKV